VGAAVLVAAATLAVPVMVYAIGGRGVTTVPDVVAISPSAPLPPSATRTAPTTAGQGTAAWPGRATPAVPRPSLSTGGSETIAPPESISDVDWANVTLKIPANQTGCPAGTAQFQDEVAVMGNERYRIGGGYMRERNPKVAYGDVDADGHQEALLVVSCLTAQPRMNPPSVVLLLATQPAVITLAVAFSSSPRPTDSEGKSSITTLQVRPDGMIVFDVQTFEGTGQCQYQLRWTGASFSGGCSQ
jgi:hypothetical protein